MTTYIVACGEKKSAYPAKVKDLYQGNYFNACFNYAREMSDSIYILSAKHGLVHPDEVIAPYNLRIGSEGSVTWQEVKEQAYNLGIADDEVVILGGSDYVKFAKKVWPNAVQVLKGGLLTQIKWLGEQARAERAKKQLSLWS